MTPDFHAVRRVLRPLPPSSSDSIWISDTLLAHSIQRFTWKYRRHGSSVPGPLEARRRTATRRKNAGLASVGRAGPQVDPATLFGPGRKVEWWNAPNPAAAVLPAASIEPSLILPLLLTGRPYPSPLTDPLDPQMRPGGAICSQKGVHMPESNGRLDDLISTCDSLAKIRKLIQRLGIDLLQRPDLSCQLLRQLLSCPDGPREVQDFILDGTLYIPGNGCFEQVVHWLSSQPRPKEAIESLYECVRSGLKFGLLSAQELQILFPKLSDVYIGQRENNVRLGDTGTIQTWYHMIILTVKDCPVFNLRELGQEALKFWFSCVAQAPYEPCALETLAVLQSCLPRANEFKVSITEEVLQKWVSYVHHNQQTVRAGHTENHHVDVELAPAGRLLSDLHPAVVAKTICRLSESLVIDVMKGTRPPAALDTWMHTLSSLSRLTADTILKCRRPWIDWLGRAALARGVSSQQGILIRFWTAISLAMNAPEVRQLQSLQEVTQHLLGLFKRQLKPNQDLLAEFIFTLQSLRLPLPPALARNIMFYTANILHLQGSVERLQADLLCISNSRLALFKEDETYKTAKTNLNAFATGLAEQVNNHPGGFLRIAHELIMRDKLSIKIITRILRHNLALKITLSKVALSAHLQSDQTKSDQSKPPLKHQNLTPSFALHLLNCLARSFAITPVLSPRQSFRKVYFIYLYLQHHTCGHAVGPEITRALWHAGVTRYRETGSSPDRLRWILEKVRKIEGDEVADRLLWTGGEDVNGRSEWIETGCKDGGGHAGSLT